jgi:sulfur-carrier protein
MIRIVLPAHLQNLAQTSREVSLDVPGEPTLGGALDELERRYPVLRGTIRNHADRQRRAFIRFFACGEDLSHEPPETRLPQAVISGEQPLRIVGAMAGG